MGLKIGGKIVLGAVLVGAIVFGGTKYLNRPKEVAKATEVGRVDLPNEPTASLQGSNALKLEFPSKTTDVVPGGVNVTILEMAWAAQSALNYANGGEHTTKGSLLNKAGFNIWNKIQNDDGKSQQDMVAWVKDYQKDPSVGGMFVIDMGSQMDSYLKTMNDLLKPLGPEYQIVIFDAVGKSFGEDQLMARDASIKSNPQNLRGKVCRGVRLGGDLDIAIKFAGDNGIPVNPNDKVYDPNALNLSYGGDFLTVVVDYNSNLTEKRQLIKNGKTAGDTSVGYDLVATWTPGDVNAVNGTPGTTTIISTREYSSMMPSMVMTCRKFLTNNASKIPDFIRAVGQAADQVRSYSDVKDYAMGINADTWKDKDKNFWITYYNGKQQGNAHLGGSMVYNLNDLDRLFGLRGGTDVYREVYKTFLNKHIVLYGKEYDGAAEYVKAVDKSYMTSALSNADVPSGDALKVDYAANITSKLASKAVHVNFATGSAVISSSSYSLLDGVFTDAVSSTGLKVGIYGYTDNTGNPDNNYALSAARAESVKQYLLKKGLDPAQIESKGFGQDAPIADNNTASGKAQNRRVEIALGN